MPATSSILLVEDEADVRELMVLHLERDGHSVTAIETGDEGLRTGMQQNFDVAILDWMLPGVSGLDLCRQFRGRFPILMVTARSDAENVVEGLETGADDYVTKPFEIPIFLARVRALIRRATRKKNPSSYLRIGRLSLEPETFTASGPQGRLDLTRSEFKLLSALMKNADRVLSRKKLISLIQGEGISVIDRTVDTHIFGLRKKLGSDGDFIETIRGVGYRVRSQE